jgi:IS5 family transposase
VLKRRQQPTLADSICDTRARKIKKVFFEQINTLLVGLYKYNS